MTSSSAWYEQSRVHLSQAITLDESLNPRSAIPEYCLAIECALMGTRVDRNPQAMIARIREWITRAEKLKAAMTVTEGGIGIRRRDSGKDAFNEVVGAESVKMALRECIVLPRTQPQVFVGDRRPWTGVLLFGPPGTGKTKLAAACCGEDCAFVAVSSSDVVSKYMGDSEKAIRDLFENARRGAKQGKRCVLFFDEIDSIGRSRDSAGDRDADKRVLAELLRQMDGVGSDNSAITVVAATNCPHALDSALRRRFQRRLYVPLPTLEDRAQILATCLGPPYVDHQLTSSQIVRLAEKSLGYSGADISALANDVLFKPVRQYLSATHFIRSFSGTLVPCSPNALSAIKMHMLDAETDASAFKFPLATFQDALDVIGQQKPSVNQNEVEKCDAFAKEFGEGTLVQVKSLTMAEISAAVEDIWRRQRVERGDQEPTLSSISNEVKEWVGWAATGVSKAFKKMVAVPAE